MQLPVLWHQPPTPSSLAQLGVLRFRVGRGVLGEMPALPLSRPGKANAMVVG